MSVSIVIPAYNEATTVGSIIKIVKSLDIVNEVIVVDDGSTDKTAEIAENAGAIVIRHATNFGKGAALKTGFKNSKGDIIAFIDADLHNINSDQIKKIIKPILDGKADVTKTKFKRKSGRVTELTAKPLLNFFFPELKFDQPLSGQFAAKRTFLNRIKFEEDYGVDVGIVLDANASGIRIKEVDIGQIEHKHSSIKGLNKMANEVVRTIVDRAMEYGRVSMMDTIGKYIRMSILGLSLTSLGLFSIFFIDRIPAIIGALILVIGLVIALCYTLKLIRRSFKVFSKSDSKLPAMKSFLHMHFPILVSVLILLAMIFTFLGGVQIDGGRLTIQPASGNLVIPLGESPDITKAEIRGPYTVDSALENENTMIRMPAEAMSTLEFNYGDFIYINNRRYLLNETRPGEYNIIRMPQDARNRMELNIGNVILDGNLRNTFKNVYAEKFMALDPNFNNLNNLEVKKGIIINPRTERGRMVNIYFDGQKVLSTAGMIENGTYSIYVNNIRSRTIKINENDPDKVTRIYWGNNVIKIEIGGPADSNVYFATSDKGRFLNFILSSNPS
ncbi:MAG: glycosyltransferase [Methanobacterium sp.]|jgi:glycosyltransferase involved in cell wall biosynthesis